MVWYTTSDIVLFVISGVTLLASLVAFLALLMPSQGGLSMAHTGPAQ